MRVSESHRCCIAGLAPQGRLSHTEEKEQSFPKLMSARVCVCAYICDIHGCAVDMAMVRDATMTQ